MPIPIYLSIAGCPGAHKLGGYKPHPRREVVRANLGYRTTARLRETYPTVYREVLHRYEEYKRIQTISIIDGILRSILVELPPPLKAALQRIGVSESFLRKYFPEERLSITTRYQEFRKAQAIKNKMTDRNRVTAIVIDLSNRGIFPSMNAVLSVFAASHLKRPEVWAIIRETREGLQPQSSI
jgi:methylphosphotriester-DNA--protein-cysteine methyltransferase